MLILAIKATAATHAARSIQCLAPSARLHGRAIFERAYHSAGGIEAVGGLRGIALIGKQEILQLLDRMAHGQVEVEMEDDRESQKRAVRAYVVSRSHMLGLLSRATDGSTEIAQNLLASLLHLRAIAVGLRLQCPECGQTAWYALRQLDVNLQCERCLKAFEFPAADPPRDVWAYRAMGPFAIENFAQGAYTVTLALHFLDQKIAERTTWVPNVKLNGGPVDGLEADSAAFFRPTWISHIAGPLLVLGECKSFNRFSPKDVARMERLGNNFPGAILCFGTLNSELTPAEKRSIRRLARAGRKSLHIGQQQNPVLVLTSAELFGQFKMADWTDQYGAKFKRVAHSVYLRRDLQEICD
jgi:hypothetical protein